MTFPLSKTLDPTDYRALDDVLPVVDQYFHAAVPQHEHRRWEYAMAIRALDVWLETRRGTGTTGHVVDVGGAGSPLYRMISDSAIVVDPRAGTGTLAEYMETAPRLSQAVFCLSVLEHVDDLDQFLYHLSCLTAPGGLLFLTMDTCGCEVEGLAHPMEVEPHHFHWMRKRIFRTSDLCDVAERLRDFEFAWLGERDLTWRGAQVYDYSFASIAMMKRR